LERPSRADDLRRLDRRLLSRFVTIAKPFWFGEERRSARALLFVLVLLLVAETEFNVFFNEQSGEFTSALAARDGARFWHSIRVFFGLLAVAVPIYATYYFVRDSLGIRWRRWLSRGFVGKYLGGRAYYGLLSEPAIDNPDQRIAEDIAAFTQKSLSFLLVLVNALLQLVAFSGLLWKISRVLVLFLVVYATTGTLITFGVFGGRMIAFNFRQLQREADYRFGLIRIRENAEAIAFYRGEGEESRELERRFGALFDNFTKLIRWTFGLNLFQYSYSLLTLGLPSVILAPRVLSGELEVGRVVQAAGAFAAILAALTVFVDNFESLSRFAAGIDRLYGFKQALDAEPIAETPPERIQIVEDSRLELTHVTVRTPRQGRTLVADLSLRVGAGEGLLIVGASGGGKSSILRAIAGLWDSGSGVIVRPRDADMLFLPQHAYMILGTLRDQLLYPGHEGSFSEDDLRSVLGRVNLPHLEQRCGGFDALVHFDKVLSVGEQQRTAFARVLLTRPKYVMLDEATSALDAANEAALYEELHRTATTIVSVSHRPALLKYHHQVLELDGHGGWRIERALHYRFPEDYSAEA
jgi:putative ATP-binding cassette transporter